MANYDAYFNALSHPSNQPQGKSENLGVYGAYFKALPAQKPVIKPKIQAKPNFFQQAEQGIGNAFNAIKNEFTPKVPKKPNSILSGKKLEPQTLPSGIKLDFTDPTQNANAHLKITPKSLKDQEQSVKQSKIAISDLTQFPQTAKLINELRIDPLNLRADPKKALQDYVNGIKDSVVAAGTSLRHVFTNDTKTPPTASERVGAGLETVARTVGAVFSPITSLFTAAQDIPGKPGQVFNVGTIAKVVNLAFTALGEGATNVSNSLIDSIPDKYVSQSAKEPIKHGLGEIVALAAQIAVGKITEVSATKHAELVDKFGETDAKTIEAKAIELANEKKRQQEIIDRKQKAYEDFVNSKKQPTPLLNSGEAKKPLQLEAKNPQANIEGEGFTMSDTANKRNLDLLKAQNDYHAALRDYNRKPTPEKLAKVQKLKDKFFSLRDSNQQTKPQTAKEILKPGEYTPQEVRKIVLNSPLKNDPEGKAIINHSIKAEQQGKNVNISHPIEDVVAQNKGNATSSVGKTIEAKAIEDELIKNSGETAKYEKSTFAEQAQKAADLINSGIDNARAVLRGEKPLPEGLRTSSLLAAMQKYVKDNPKDAAEILQEMSNSPLIGENISKGAQEVSFSRMIEQDSATAKLQDLKKSRIDKVGGIDKVDKTKKTLVSDTKKVHLSKEDLSWSNFLDSIKC